MSFMIHINNGVSFLIVQLFLVSFLTLFLLNKYADFKLQNKFVIFFTFVAWYFSFLIIFFLPLDVIQTLFRLCTQEYRSESNHTLQKLILPFSQSFIRAPNFHIFGKVKHSLISNLIYYVSFALLLFAAFLYNVRNPRLHLNWNQLKSLGSSASNTWGLFLLVLLLGYSLVKIPLQLWNASFIQKHISQLYFNIAKLNLEKCEAQEHLEDVIQEIIYFQEFKSSTNVYSNFHHDMNIVIDKLPKNVHKDLEDMKDKMSKNLCQDSKKRKSGALEFVSEKKLIALHDKVIKRVRAHTKICNQWSSLLAKCTQMQHVYENCRQHERIWQDRNTAQSLPSSSVSSFLLLTSLRFKWLWRCILRFYFLRFLAILSASFSLSLIWCEVTSFKKSISLIYIIAHKLLTFDSDAQKYSYLLSHFSFVHVMCLVVVAYLSAACYYAIFKMRFFNYYHISPNHQTDESSLLFCATFLTRLASPLSLNFLFLIGMDDRLVSPATAFTRVMGHMSLLFQSFNVYFPAFIVVVCVANYFSCIPRILNFFGVEQYISGYQDESMQALVEEGRQLVRREEKKEKLLKEDFNDERRLDLLKKLSKNSSKRKTINDEESVLLHSMHSNEYQSSVVDPNEAFDF